jgi:hypothetical protein
MIGTETPVFPRARVGRPLESYSPLEEIWTGTERGNSFLTESPLIAAVEARHFLRKSLRAKRLFFMSSLLIAYFCQFAEKIKTLFVEC